MNPGAYGSFCKAAAFLLLFSALACRPAVEQTAAHAQVGSGLAGDLREFVETPSVSGHENELSERIRTKLARFHPVVDNLGDVIVTIGSGSPHRLMVTPIDEPGFVVSGITPGGYLRLQRLPQTGGLPAIYDSLYSAQPVKVRTASGEWIDGVVAGISVHLHRAGEALPPSSDIENMYVDIGATSPEEVRKAGVDLLSPVAINRALKPLADKLISGASIGDKFGAAALVDVLRHTDAAAIQGTLTVAFVVQERVEGRGLNRVLRTTQADEMIYVGRLLPGGNVEGLQGVHRAPRREPGSGVLVGLPSTSGELSGLAADLRKLADANKVPFASDYSGSIVPSGYLAPPAFPEKWAHMGIATAWPDTPAESISVADLMNLDRALAAFAGSSKAEETLFHIDGCPGAGECNSVADDTGRFRNGGYRTLNDKFGIAGPLAQLVETYGASGQEESVRDDVKKLLPAWAKPETDDAGNLMLRVGTAPAGSKTPRIFVVAHMDEIGFRVKSIAEDGRLMVETLGGMDLSFYQGHPVLVHASRADLDGVMELPHGWDEQNFKWPEAREEQTLRVDAGARSAKEATSMGIAAGDTVTIPKRYRQLLGTRANGRSFDDRVGCTALISAAWALGGPLKDRDVTFVWSTSEELGLVGAGKLATRLAAEGRVPDYVFAVDTFVSSDSPLESKRFAGAELGKGFVVRAVDGSNVAPQNLVEKLVRLAHANQIPAQYGVSAGGNDGASFVPFGSVDIPLGWPLRYSHSPGEVIDTRDAGALARIVAAIARSW